MSGNGVRIRELASTDDPRVLAEFFAAEIDPSYISHGEIQGGRALDEDTFAPNLVAVLEQELRAAMSSDRLFVGIAMLGEQVVGLALVERGGRHATLHDVVVARSARRLGVATQIVAWVEEQARARGADRVFLESGITNRRAHEFFERCGFQVCSLVMTKRL